MLIKKKVLIVDDQDYVRDQFRNFLEEQYNVIEASNGLEFIEIFEKFKNKIDIVFLDHHMPLKSGLDALKEVRLLDGGDKLLVFMLTTETSMQAKQLGKQLGLKGWITKPFDMKLIKRVIDESA